MKDDLYAVNKKLKDESDKQVRAENREDRRNDWSNFNSAKWGLAAGLGMSLYLVVIQLLGYNEVVALKYANYLILGAFIAYGLTSLKTRLGDDFRYSDGMKMGAILTAVSGLMLGAMNFLLYAWTDTLAFDKLTETGDSIGSVATISGILFFETLVFGLILTFICMQYIKLKRSKVREVK